MADVTELLIDWSEGNEAVRGAVVEALYAELTAIAARHLAHERGDHDLAPPALVHEAYLKLVDMDRIDWRNRAHFLAMAARVMREILVDEARRRRAAKRDGGLRVTLSTALAQPADPATDALVLHDALQRLAAVDPRRAELVELRYFGGLTIEETSEVLQMSPATVKRSWDVARGWLYRHLSGPGPV